MVEQMSISVSKPKKRRFPISRMILSAICAASLILLIFSFVSTKWIVSTLHFHERGLWKYCNETACVSLDDPYVRSLYKGVTKERLKWLEDGTTPDWLSACRYIMIVGIVSLSFATLISVFSWFNQRIHGYVTSIFAVLGFIFTVISIYLFEEETEYFQDNQACGSGWGIGYLSAILCFVAAFTGFCIF